MRDAEARQEILIHPHELAQVTESLGENGIVGRDQVCFNEFPSFASDGAYSGQDWLDYPRVLGRQFANMSNLLSGAPFLLRIGDDERKQRKVKRFKNVGVGGPASLEVDGAAVGGYSVVDAARGAVEHGLAEECPVIDGGESMAG